MTLKPLLWQSSAWHVQVYLARKKPDLSQVGAQRPVARAAQHARTVTPYTLHPALNTRHPTLDTRHSTLNTQHSTLNTQHSTLNRLSYMEEKAMIWSSLSYMCHIHSMYIMALTVLCVPHSLYRGRANFVLAILFTWIFLVYDLKIPHTLHPTPHTSHPTPHTPRPTPHNPHPKPHTPSPKPQTPNPSTRPPSSEFGAQKTVRVIV